MGKIGIYLYSVRMNCVEVHDGPDGHRRGVFIDTKSAWLDANMPSAFADGSA